MAEQINMLFGVYTPASPWNIVFVGVLIPHRQGEGDLLLNFGIPLASPEWLKLET